MITVVEPGFEILTDIDGIEQHIERCGRVCYKSEDRITDSSAGKFVRNICRRRHESVLEHASITVIVVCSRSCSHQLVRHRIAAYSQESQRYCDYGKRGLKVICPPRIGLEPGSYTAECFENCGWLVWKNDRLWGPGTEQQRQWVVLVDSAYSEYLAERKEGIPPEDARYVLPNATKTELAVTFNLRQWRHFFQVRCDKHAQWEIREIAKALLTSFSEAMPSVFEDLSEEINSV